METHGIKSVLVKIASLNLFLWLAGLLIIAMSAGPFFAASYYGSPWFVGLLCLLAANTLACVWIRFRSVPWATLVSHAGILLIFAGAVLSLTKGLKGDLQLRQGEPPASAVKMEGGQAWKLPFQVRLKEFTIEYHGQGGHVLSIRHEKQGWSTTLNVEPGKTYALPKGGSLGVKEYNPDFFIDMDTRAAGRRSNEPNNPALRMRFSGRPEKDLWVFENFPLMHQDNLAVKMEFIHRDAAVKQYKSRLELLDEGGKTLVEDTIWVNHPLRFGGVTLYQSGFDPEDARVSILRVSSDPGVPLVYGGFLVLLAGLLWNTLRRFS